MKQNSCTRDIPVIAKCDGYFITECRTNGISYTKDVTKALVFNTPKEARKLIPEFLHADVRLLDAKRKTAPEYGVIECGKRSGVYVRGVNSRKRLIEFTTDSVYAKKFMTENAARKWIEKYAARTTGCKWAVCRIR